MFMSAESVVRDYFAVPYGDRVFVYTNVVTVADLKKHTFLELLSHRRAIGGRSVAMAIHEAIKKDYGDIRGKRVLDVGSSIGHFSFMMAREGANVIGIECEEIKVKVAMAIAEIRASNAKFVQMRIEEYLCKITHFDLALMHNVFDYIPVEKNTCVLQRVSLMADILYTTVLIDPEFVTTHSEYTKYKRLLEKIYGSRDLWVFWK